MWGGLGWAKYHVERDKNTKGMSHEAIYKSDKPSQYNQQPKSRCKGLEPSHDQKQH